MNLLRYFFVLAWFFLLTGSAQADEPTAKPQPATQALAGQVHAPDYFETAKNFKLDNPEFRAPLTAMGEIPLSMGGGKIVEQGGARYILAVGLTDCRSDPSPKENMRRVTVARSKAVKELTKLFEKIQVTAKEETRDETIVQTDSNGKKTATRKETSLDEYREVITSYLKNPEPVATWISPDGQFFCVAVGRRLD